MAKIQYLLETKTGEKFKFSEILSDSTLNLKEFRIEWTKHLKFKTPLFICGMCKQPLSLRSGIKDKKELFLVHPKNSKDCNWKSGREKSYEESLKDFHNIRESKEHKELKAFIISQLNQDNNFTDAVPEKRVTNNFTKTYKIPDVRALQTTHRKNIKIETNIVFEIQLSSTFIDVILEREKFYFENNDNLIWIFAHYPKNLNKTKMTEDDVLFTSKKNIFVLDNEAKLLSIKNRSLYLKNIHLIPIINKNGELDSKWSDNKILNINEISFDKITGKSYFYNFEYHRTRLLYQLKMKDKNYKKKFNDVQYYISLPNKNSTHLGALLRKNVFNPKTEEYLIEAIHQSQKIISFIFEIIYMNTPTNYKFINIFNHAKSKDNRILQMIHSELNPAMKSKNVDIMIKALDYYGKSQYLIDIDKKGTLIKKIQNYKKYIMDDLPAHYEIALEYLFPELLYISYKPKREKDSFGTDNNI